MNLRYGLHVRRTIGASSMVRFPRVNAPPAISPMEHGLQTLLPRVVDGTRARWNWMSFEDFLRQINVETWDGQPALVGMVPSPARREMTRVAGPLS